MWGYLIPASQKQEWLLQPRKTRAEGRSQPHGVKSQGLDVQSKRPLRCRALSLPLAHSMDVVYPRCRRVLRWGRTDKAQWLGLEGRGWRAKPPSPGRAVVQGELAGARSSDAGSPPYTARGHSCPGPESRRSPQASRAPPVPPGPAGGRAQVKGRQVVQGPRGRETEGAGGEPGAPRGPAPPGETAPFAGGPSRESKAGAKEHRCLPHA